MIGEIIIKVEKKLVLDVTSKNTSEVMAKQYDVNSRFLRIALKSGYCPIKVDSSSVVIINAKRSDGEVKSFSGAVNEDGTVTVPITGWMTETDKSLRCDVSVIDGKNEEKLTTMAFDLVVETATNSGEEIVDDDRYDVLVSLISDYSRAKSACEAATEAATEAAERAERAALTSNAATDNATAAANRANAAAKGAENVNISAAQTTTGADITVTNRDGEETTVHIDTLFAADSWADIRNAVRLGLGPKLFPVGYEFTVHNSDYNYDMVWRVVGHDHHKAANKKLEHTMTLEMKNTLSKSNGSGNLISMDPREALYYAENGLEAGTYNFIWDYSSGSVKSGTFQFTLTKDIPSGGQVVINTSGGDKALTSCDISTYADVGISETIESGITITSGSGGINLGTIQGYTSSDKNLNCGQRILFGSNNYAQSAVDQFLNSFAEAGSVWTPQTVFDRPSTWIDTGNGFIHGLPDDFLSVVEPAVIPCHTNSVFETNSLDGTGFSVGQEYELEKKFFLLSNTEVFGTGNDGKTLEYYVGLTAAERIHYDNANTAQAVWLRSSVSSHAGTFYYINASGAENTNNARNSRCVAAACIIA